MSRSFFLSALLVAATIAQQAAAQEPKVSTFEKRLRAELAQSGGLTAEDAAALFAEYDLILDGTDNFDTRYLVNNLREAFDLPGTPIRLHTRVGDNPYDRNKRAG